MSGNKAPPGAFCSFAEITLRDGGNKEIVNSSSIVLIAAMELEVKPLLPRFKRISKKNPRLYEWQSHDKKVFLFISGLGGKKAKAAARLAAELRPRLVVNLGYAGGLSPFLACGELFVPSEVCDIHGKSFPCFPVSDITEKRQFGRLLTADRIIVSADEKAKLHAAGDAVDMESFFIAEIMHEQGIPFVAIRVISDAARDSLPIDFNLMLQGKLDALQSMMSLIFRTPWKVVDLVRLGIQSKRISRQLCNFSLSFLSRINTHG